MRRCVDKHVDRTRFNQAMTKENISLEQKAAAAILEQPIEVTVGDETYVAAPPSVATLIMVSALVSQLPSVQLDKEHILEDVLRTAKDCRKIGEITAVLILGVKFIKAQEKTRLRANKRGFRAFFHPKHERETVTVEGLATRLLEELSPSEMYGIIARLLSRMEIGDFFALTTFLQGVNQTRATRKVVTAATARGQSSEE